MSPIDRIDKGLPLSVHLSCLNSLDRAGADMMLLRPRCFCLCIPVTPRFFVQNQIQNLIWETRYDRLSEDMTANKPKQAIFTAMLGHCWLCLNTVAHCATSSQVPAAVRSVAHPWAGWCLSSCPGAVPCNRGSWQRL